MYLRGRDLVLWAVRIALPVLAFAMTLTAIEEGVDFSERPGMPQAPLLNQIYYATGLFFFGGLDLGVPVGGPVWARDMMWFCYFFAPMVTATALIEGALRTFTPQFFRNPLRDHVVLVGHSQVARRMLSRMREDAPRRSIVLLDDDPNHIADLQARQMQGDIRDAAVRRGLRLDRAHRVLLLTDDDFVNLDAATAILQEFPRLQDRVVAHVKDSHLLRAAGDLHTLDGANVFNMHANAARHLVHTRLMQHFESTEPRDVVVLAGFGRFGQALLHELQTFLPGTFDQIVLIDLDCDRTARAFHADIGFREDVRRTVLDADLRDPAVWEQVDALLSGHTSPVFVLASGDDAANLRSAIRLATTHPDALVVARTFDPSPFGERAAAASGFAIVSIGSLLEESMPESWWH